MPIGLSIPIFQRELRSREHAIPRFDRATLWVVRRVLGIAIVRHRIERRHVISAGFYPKDTVVHPNHGIGNIRDVVEMEINGGCERFLVVDFSRTSLTVRVPVRTLKQCGLREVSSRETMQAALDSLADSPATLSGHWSRWSALYAEKLNSGQPALLAEILRDLTPSGSSWKAKLYEEALIRLAEELALVENIELEEAQSRIAARLPKAAETPR